MARGTRGADSGVLLIHGGLWEDAMDAQRFWGAPGIVAGLTAAGLSVAAPDRLRRPPSWIAEVEHLAPFLAEHAPAVLVAGSNGCSVAVRLAVTFPDFVAKLILAWPATARNAAVDARTRDELAELGAPDQTIQTLLGGEALRGVSDSELAALPMPIAVLPSFPENPFHRRQTVDALRRLLPHAEELPGCPEPPRPDFPSFRDGFVAAVERFVRD
jgi:pimeloyl-ACP methyl ester carboxylesterase